MLKKITKPILEQLKQGVSPEKLAMSIAFGLVLGIMPFIGLTTLACIIAAYFFRLNQVAIQTVNYIAYPFQIILFIPFIRLGEKLFRLTSTSITISEIQTSFKIGFIFGFNKYFTLFKVGMTVWLLCFPIVYFVIYFISKKILVKFMH
jgi:uncharacterized protein (DUF2062 family)